MNLVYIYIYNTTINHINTTMTYKTERIKEYQKKIDYLKLQKIEVSNRLNTINSSLEKLNILFNQEKDRIDNLDLNSDK